MLTVFILSDSTGETAEAVTRAALAQFSEDRVQMYRLARVKSIVEVREILQEVSKENGLIAYTLVMPELKNTLENEAKEFGISIIDLLGPLIAKVENLTGVSQLSQAGRSHLLDETYFRRIEAIDFAIRYDDGKNQDGIVQADVVLTGVSRTSKTPNCMYLAHHWGLKAANVPLISGMEPPPKLFGISEKKIIGLTIDPHMLLEIRCARAKVLGLPSGTDYTDPDVIEQEVNFAKQIFRRLGCHVIDVSNKAIEEASSEIYLFLRK